MNAYNSLTGAGPQRAKSMPRHITTRQDAPVKMIDLRAVTLICVDTVNPNLAIKAMHKCLSSATFGSAVLVTKKNPEIAAISPQIHVIETGEIRNIEDYSTFIIKSIEPLTNTSHALIVQWDGFIQSAEAWDPCFLDYDYIGATWPQYRDRMRVGNGGFSLRSKKLLLALQDPAIKAHNPEDECITRKYRTYLESKHGISIAPEAVADRFSQERKELPFDSFGFHGLARLARTLQRRELEELVDELPPSVFKSTEARGFIKNLLDLGQLDLAKRAFCKRTQYSHHATIKEKIGNIRLKARLTFKEKTKWDR